MAQQFPRTMVGGVSLPRMLIGTNWMLGYSHTTPSADNMIRARFSCREAFEKVLEAYLEYGIDAIMGPFPPDSLLLEAARHIEDKTGKKIILIDTPIINVDDTAEGRAEAASIIRRSAGSGAAFCLPHHSSVEQLVNKNKGEITRLPDYLDMIRQNGMIPGLSAHMPELIIYSDKNGYDVETYVQIYNCMGFLMQIEIEYILNTIWNAKKPVMTIKSMAAGRVSPFVGITFSYATLRERDMVTMGAHTPAEVHEDVEIAFAAIERRKPELEGRSSPNKNAAVMGGDK
jgi:hypothetical protein